jgi:hypothetical protein
MWWRLLLNFKYMISYHDIVENITIINEISSLATQTCDFFYYILNFKLDQEKGSFSISFKKLTKKAWGHFGYGTRGRGVPPRVLRALRPSKILWRVVWNRLFSGMKKKWNSSKYLQTLRPPFLITLLVWRKWVVENITIINEISSLATQTCDFFYYILNFKLDILWYCVACLV